VFYLSSPIILLGEQYCKLTRLYKEDEPNIQLSPAGIFIWV